MTRAQLYEVCKVRTTLQLGCRNCAAYGDECNFYKQIEHVNRPYNKEENTNGIKQTEHRKERD